MQADATTLWRFTPLTFVAVNTYLRSILYQTIGKSSVDKEKDEIRAYPFEISATFISLLQRKNICHSFIDNRQ